MNLLSTKKLKRESLFSSLKDYTCKKLNINELEFSEDSTFSGDFKTDELERYEIINFLEQKYGGIIKFKSDFIDLFSSYETSMAVSKLLDEAEESIEINNSV